MAKVKLERPIKAILGYHVRPEIGTSKLGIYAGKKLLKKVPDMKAVETYIDKLHEISLLRNEIKDMKKANEYTFNKEKTLNRKIANLDK